MVNQEVKSSPTVDNVCSFGLFLVTLVTQLSTDTNKNKVLLHKKLCKLLEKVIAFLSTQCLLTSMLLASLHLWYKIWSKQLWAKKSTVHMQSVNTVPVKQFGHTFSFQRKVWCVH